MNDTSTIVTTDVLATRPRIRWTWSVYLGCSWTWCVGMFLPVLLLRDFGLWGWVVFAIPNVIGAALVGVWRYPTAPKVSPPQVAIPEVSSGASRVVSAHSGKSFLQKHQRAMVWFSIITILFHVFFVAWFVERLVGSWATPAFVFAAVLFTVFIKFNRVGWGAWLALAVSVVMACVFFLNVGVNQPPVVLISAAQSMDLLFLAPAIVIGFMLCPHLDLTIQHARASMSPQDARPTFMVAYCGVFLVMIVFTLMYAGSLDITLATGKDLLMTRWIAFALALHLATQSGFTVAIHSARLLKTTKTRHMVRGLLACFVAVIVLMMLGRSIVHGSRLLAYDPGEVIYRMFLGFYGLVFPAYAWAAWLWRREEKLNLAAWLLPVLLALPMFTAGFLTRQPGWLVPGTALVLVIPWLLLPKRTNEISALA